MHAFHASPSLPETRCASCPVLPVRGRRLPSLCGCGAVPGGAPARAAAAGTGMGRGKDARSTVVAGKETGAAGRWRKAPLLAGKEAAYGKRGMGSEACGGVRARAAALHKGREEAREAACAALRRRPGAGAALLQAGAAGWLYPAGAA